VIIVGRVLDRVGGDRTLRSFLYSDDRPRDADGRTMRGPGAAAPAGDPVPAPPAAGGAPHSARRPAQTPPAPRPPQAPPSPSDGRDGPGRILILAGPTRPANWPTSWRPPDSTWSPPSPAGCPAHGSRGGR